MGPGKSRTAADWLRAADPPVAAWYSSAPGFRSGFGEHAWSVLSGEPDPDHNWIAIHTPGKEGEFSLRSRLASLRSAGLPGTVCVLGEAERELVAALIDLDLTRVGPLPHYAADLDAIAPAHVDGESVILVADDVRFASAMETIDRTFEFSEGYTGRCFSAELLRGRDLRFWTIERENRIASVCVTWREGEISYLVIMATAPEWQGQGLGERLVRTAIAGERAAGARWMHLVASDAGARLYRKVGFELVAEHVLWTTSF